MLQSHSKRTQHDIAQHYYCRHLSVVLKRNSKIVVEQNNVVVFRQQFVRLLEEARESWKILVARGVSESKDNQVVLLRSELEMLEEIGRDLSV